MRPFLRIARGKTVAGAAGPNACFPHRCCVQRPFHTGPLLQLAEQKERKIHGPEEIPEELMESEAYEDEKNLKPQREEEDDSSEDSQHVPSSSAESLVAPGGLLMITEEVARAIGKPWRDKMREKSWLREVRKAERLGKKPPPKPVDKPEYKVPQLYRFTNSAMLEQDSDIRDVTRRAVIEIYTHMIRPHHPREPVSFPFGFRAEESVTSRVKVTKDVQSGHFKFDYGSPEVLRAVGKGWRADRASSSSSGTPSEVPPVAEDDAWTEIPVEEKALKFAIVKRVTQLSGFRLPDHCLQSISTAGDLANQMIRHRPGATTAYGRKPKLADQLTNTELPAGAALNELQNVKIHKKRILLTDREKAIGRLVTIPLITKKHVETLGKIPVAGKD